MLYFVMWAKNRTFASANCIKAVPLHFDVERGCLGVLSIADYVKMMKMRRNKILFGVALAIGIALSSCSNNSDLPQDAEGGQGMLSLSLSAEASFASTRAVTESVYNEVDNYTIVVTDKSGVERLNCKGSEISSAMPLVLSVGEYTVRAFYGVESPASRDDFYVCGESQGYIRPDEEDRVEVVCTPTCGRIRVEFDEEMSTYFSDYKVSFTGTKALKGGTIDWLKDDTEPWYVKLEEGGEVISFTFSTTVKEEYIHTNQQQVATQTGTFTLDRNKGYKMNISPSYTAIGKVGVSITVDEGTNDIPVDIEVPMEWI